MEKRMKKVEVQVWPDYDGFPIETLSRKLKRAVPKKYQSTALVFATTYQATPDDQSEAVFIVTYERLETAEEKRMRERIERIRSKSKRSHDIAERDRLLKKYPLS